MHADAGKRLKALIQALEIVVLPVCVLAKALNLTPQ
jgi:hypothetical protein